MREMFGLPRRHPETLLGEELFASAFRNAMSRDASDPWLSSETGQPQRVYPIPRASGVERPPSLAAPMFGADVQGIPIALRRKASWTERPPMFQPGLMASGVERPPMFAPGLMASGAERPPMFAPTAVDSGASGVTPADVSARRRRWADSENAATAELIARRQAMTGSAGTPGMATSPPVPMTRTQALQQAMAQRQAGGSQAMRGAAAGDQMPSAPPSPGGGIMSSIGGWLGGANEFLASRTPEQNAALIGLAQGMGEMSGWQDRPVSFSQMLANGLRRAQERLDTNRALRARETENDLHRDAWRMRALQQQAAMEQAAQQQAMLEQYVANLPPEQRAAAMMNPEAFSKAQIEAQFRSPMQVGNDVIDPRTGKLIYRAPFAPREPRDAAVTWGLMSPEEVKAAGLPPGSYQRNSRGEVEPIRGQSGGITIGPDGTVQIGGAAGQPLTAATNTQLQQDAISATDRADRLARIRDTFKSDWLTIGEKGSTALARAMDKLGVSSDAQKAQLAERSSAMARLITNLNQYIRETTGATMTEGETERLRAAMPNEEDSPAEFDAKLDAAITMAEEIAASKIGTLGGGVRLRSRPGAATPAPAVEPIDPDLPAFD